MVRCWPCSIPALRRGRSSIDATEDIRCRQYLVYGPKALAGIEGIADTLADRASDSDGAQRPPDAASRYQQNGRHLCPAPRGLQGWAEHYGEQIDEMYDDLPMNSIALTDSMTASKTSRSPWWSSPP